MDASICYHLWMQAHATAMTVMSSVSYNSSPGDVSPADVSRQINTVACATADLVVRV